jgi:hypothetical protein
VPRDAATAIATRTIAIALIAAALDHGLAGCAAAAKLRSRLRPRPARRSPLAEGTVAQRGPPRHHRAASIARVARGAARAAPPRRASAPYATRSSRAKPKTAKLDRDLDVQLGARAVLARRLLHDLAAEAGQARDHRSKSSRRPPSSTGSISIAPRRFVRRARRRAPRSQTRADAKRSEAARAVGRSDARVAAAPGPRSR